MDSLPSLDRRGFLKASLGVAGAALAFPLIIPASARGADGFTAPSNRINLGCIGLGGMGSGNMNAFLGQSDCRVVAVCDVDKSHLDNAASRVNNAYKNQDAKAYHDFRDLLNRGDIDAISLATPDHWHAIPAIMAARKGIDIYGEKPLSHSWYEGRRMCDAVRDHGRIWQTGSWQRSTLNFRQAVELVRNGYIGKVHTVEVGLPSHNALGTAPFCEVPPELDYDFWVGPSPMVPYSSQRTHWNWRWQLDFGGGQLMDWIGHHGDIAHWGLGYDETGPVEVDASGVFPAEGIYNAAQTYKSTLRYRSGVVMTIAGGDPAIRGGTKWIGDKGWVWVTRGALEASSPKILKAINVRHPWTAGPMVLSGTDNQSVANHHRNFLDSVRSRARTITPCEVAHRSATLGHLSLVSMRLGRKIRWNPDTEEVLGDPAASALLRPAMRAPWQLI